MKTAEAPRNTVKRETRRGRLLDDRRLLGPFSIFLAATALSYGILAATGHGDVLKALLAGKIPLP